MTLSITANILFLRDLYGSFIGRRAGRLVRTHHFFKQKTRNQKQRDHGAARDKPVAARSRALAEPIHTMGVLSARAASECWVSSFRLLFVLRSFLIYLFWFTVVFRFQMQLRPRPRRGSPLGGVSRRGSASAVAFCARSVAAD